jgi:protein-disulfide isomerase
MFGLMPLLIAAQLAALNSQPAPLTATAERLEIVVYSDFQCPFCAQFAPSARALQSDGVDGMKTTVTFKNFPLSIHPNAQLAHQAGMAAKEQGKFWEMHDLLFGNQHRVERADLIGYAQKIGLDIRRFERDMDSDRVKQVIAADVADGAKVGVTGTPSFLINGKIYSGSRTLAQLQDLVSGEQRRARALAEVPEALMSKGASDSAVTLEFFADLQSPISRHALELVEQAVGEYASTVRVQFRNFPLAFHPQAALAHEAAMIAAHEGLFWEFAHFVLQHQDSLREQDLVAYAGSVGLDVFRFAGSLREHRYGPRVDADVIAGQSHGLHGSPVIIINETRIDGVPTVPRLIECIEAALAAGHRGTIKQ